MYQIVNIKTGEVQPEFWRDLPPAEFVRHGFVAKEIEFTPVQLFVGDHGFEDCQRWREADLRIADHITIVAEILDDVYDIKQLVQCTESGKRLTLCTGDPSIGKLLTSFDDFLITVKSREEIEEIAGSFLYAKIVYLADFDTSGITIPINHRIQSPTISNTPVLRRSF